MKMLLTLIGVLSIVSNVCHAESAEEDLFLQDFQITTNKHDSIEISIDNMDYIDWINLLLRYCKSKYEVTEAPKTMDGFAGEFGSVESVLSSALHFNGCSPVVDHHSKTIKLEKRQSKKYLERSEINQIAGMEEDKAKKLAPHQVFNGNLTVAYSNTSLKKILGLLSKQAGIESDIVIEDKIVDVILHTDTPLSALKILCRKHNLSSELLNNTIKIRYKNEEFD